MVTSIHFYMGICLVSLLIAGCHCQEGSGNSDTEQLRAKRGSYGDYKHIQLCKEVDFQGCFDALVSAKCMDLGTAMENFVSSANTTGLCVMFYESRECKGASIKVAPGTPSHNNFGTLDFNKKASATQLCEN